MQDKQLPYDLDAEKAVLGAILLASDVLPVLQSILRPDDFYSEINGKIYEAMIAMQSNGTRIDILTAFQYVQRHGINVTAYELSELTSKVATSANAVEWAQILAEFSMLRKLWKLGTETAQKAIAKDDPFNIVESMFADVTKSIQRQAGNILGANILLNEILAEFDELNRLKTREAIGIIPLLCGIRKMVNIWQPGNLVIIAGRPGMGKTGFTKSIIYDFVKNGKSVYFLSLEMRAKEITQRFIREFVSRSKEQIYYDIFDDETYKELKKSMSHIWNETFIKDGKTRFYMNDCGAVTMQQLRGQIAGMKAQDESLAAVVIDYLQLITPAANNKSTNDQVAQISRELKQMAKQYNLTIFALSQLSRGVESRADKRPILSDIRDSGAIEQDADIVLFLYRPEYYGEQQALIGNESYPAEGLLEVICAKYRDGAKGSQPFNFDGALTKITDYIPQAKPFTMPKFENKVYELTENEFTPF